MQDFAGLPQPTGELLLSGNSSPKKGDDISRKKDNSPPKVEDSIVVRGPIVLPVHFHRHSCKHFCQQMFEQVGADDDLLEHAAICIYDALKYHGPKRKLGPRAQFFYLLRTRKKVWFHTYTAVLLVNCLGSYLLEGVVFTTAPQFSIFAYILNLLCLGVYIADLVFQWMYATATSFFRRRWNRVQFVVGRVELSRFPVREQ